MQIQIAGDNQCPKHKHKDTKINYYLFINGRYMSVTKYSQISVLPCLSQILDKIFTDMSVTFKMHMSVPTKYFNKCPSQQQLIWWSPFVPDLGHNLNLHFCPHFTFGTNLCHSLNPNVCRPPQ